MGNVTFGAPPELCLALRDSLGIKCFIETGTWKAGTTLWAAKHFNRVITIEGHEDRYHKTLSGIDTTQYPNVKFLLGDSRTELWQVIRELTEPILFFLDAHWCYGGAKEAHEMGDECPLMEELTAINEHYLAAEFVILIDDARLFLNHPPYPHDPAQWPTYQQVVEKLSEYDRVVMTKDDVIITIPFAHRQVLHEFYGGR